MMATLIRRLQREEKGYSLVISMLLLSIMMVLLAVSLDAGNASLRESGLSIEWSKSLTVAEAGVNNAVTLLGESRSASNPCQIGNVLNTVCTGGGGEYQLLWSASGKKILVSSIGYYPTKANPTFVREVQATYEPVPSFKYAIYSRASLAVFNGMRVAGDVYSDGDITVGGGTAEVCGSITSSGGSVTMDSSNGVVKEDATLNCSDKSGNIWTGGAGGISLKGPIDVEGNITAGNPSTVAGSCGGSTYAITKSGGSVNVAGTATACGTIGSINAASALPGTSSSQPVPVPFPAFTFDPNNYSNDVSDPQHLQCYPASGTCGSNDDDSAAQLFSAWAATQASLTGTFAVWQRNPSQASGKHIVLPDNFKVGGDFTLITNAPVDFGNTSKISTTSSSVTSDLTVVSTYAPTGSCSASLVMTGGADCSVYGKNAIEFDSGDAADPDDGVVGLLYTTGEMAFGNGPQPAIGEGALYANTMDFKNSFNVIYNSRVERVLGFGSTYEQVLWQEINV